MMRDRRIGVALTISAVALMLVRPAAQPQHPAIALVGATVVDGNGGAPIADAVVLLDGTRIKAVGPKSAVAIPAGAQQIDARGRWIIPGMIDTNVHLSLYGGQNDRYETMVRYQPRDAEIVLEAAQIDLGYGVTTVRDSYGALGPLTKVRDRIARGEAVGTRILAAGNILGWSGPYSFSFSKVMGQLTLFQEQMNDYIAQGGGEELMDMTPDELRVAIDKYLDKGPDFLKYGGTSHWENPTYIGFSADAQKVIVDEAHKRSKNAETHSTSLEGLRVSIASGIDGIQHPELLDDRDMPDTMVKSIVDRHLYCSMLASSITGPAWERHLKSRKEAQEKQAEAAKDAARGLAHEQTTWEKRKAAADLGDEMESRRHNAQKLIAAGCITTPGTDSYWAAAPELSRTPKPPEQDHGIGTIMAIEGFVELGMTPMQAITAGTKNGAIAARRLSDLGTIEAGKLADLVVLTADPIADIHNIRKVADVYKEGQRVDRAHLPQTRVLSVAPRTPTTSQ